MRMRIPYEYLTEEYEDLNDDDNMRKWINK